MQKKNILIRCPLTEEEFENYYLLRYQVLRAPWNQEKGSEKDNLEDIAIHRMALLHNSIIACGRIHFIDQHTAQIRYMAVNDNYLNKGIGKKILHSLENAAREKNIQIIILHARENAVGFYKNFDYQLMGKSHLLFDEIQHYKMKKIV